MDELIEVLFEGLVFLFTKKMFWLALLLLVGGGGLVWWLIISGIL